MVGLTGMAPDAPAQCQSPKLTAADGAFDDQFGFSVALSGNTAVVGAFLDDNRVSDSGAAYVFEKIGGVWAQTAKLTAADGAAFDWFGFSVAVSGNTAVIGSVFDDDRGTASGSAYVFEKFGALWSQTAKLTAADGAHSDEFGFSVALSGNTAVIGVKGGDGLVADSGSAYVFEKIGGVWTQSAKLTAADGAEGDQFGYSVAVSGDTAVIGAFLDNDLGSNSGSAYVFEKIGGVWTQSAKLTAADGAEHDQFGFSVAVSGDTAVIGSRNGDGLVANSGSAYVFEKFGGLWSQTTKLTASDGTQFNEFGFSVALSGDTAVIGARGDDDRGTASGSAYVFEKIGALWSQTAKLTASDGAQFDEFGVSVALSGDTAVIGARNDDDLGFNSGSAYVFALEGEDCNGNGIPDECDIASGDSQDANGDGVPDECRVVLDLDIKPGACPNPVNLKSRGVVPMAIVGSESFDVTEIDIDSLVLSRADGVGGFVVALRGPPGPGIRVEDVTTPFEGDLCDCQELEGDGFADLVLKFSTPELMEMLELNSLQRQMVVTLTLRGTLLDGTELEASDCVVLVSEAAAPRSQRSIRKLR